MFTNDLIVGYGASTMQGAGDTELGGVFNRIQAPLRAAWTTRRFLNHGVGGDSTRDMLKRRHKLAAEANGAKYDLVVLLGSNDMPRERDAWPANRVPTDEYERNLDELLGSIRGGRSLFVSSFPVSQELTGVAPETFDRYMEIALRVAQRQKYAVWDAYAELRSAPRERLEALWAPDGLHFNPAGHQWLADGIVARVAG
jgi:lysophospholipase L1-like esterase